MPPEVQVGQLVRSKAGRDKDRYYLVYQTMDDYFVYVIDGESRKVTNPKKKNTRHLQTTNQVAYHLVDRLKAGDPVTDAEVRAAIKELVAIL